MYAVAAANSEIGNVLYMTKEYRDTYIMGVILTQYSPNKSLKDFGECRGEAVLKELSSLNGMNNFFPMYATTLTKEQRDRAIPSLVFSKEKCDGIIKGRKCAIGTPQRASSKKKRQPLQCVPRGISNYHKQQGKANTEYKMHKALYIMMHIVLLFYHKLVGNLEANALKINLHDPCVGNMEVGGS